MKEKEQSAKEIKDQKQYELEQWRISKAEKRIRFQMRAQNFIEELDRQRESTITE